ncbi:MAG: glycosyltransferase family 9 protein [Bacteroidales bacterium]|nr:glycosyltransferase family 9 protein [Bacteroidales bacterium]
MGSPRVLISRTDSLGDVLLTLPVAGMIRCMMPSAEILFMGMDYTRPIATSCVHIDRFIDWGQISNRSDPELVGFFREMKVDVILHVFPVRRIALLARKASVPIRVGASGRSFHYYTCNRLVPMTRRRSDLHEAQLNLKLLRPLGLTRMTGLDEIPSLYGFSPTFPLREDLASMLDTEKFRLILHPGSRGSTREWGWHNFADLIGLLPGERYEIFITGTRKEGDAFRDELHERFPQVHDLTGTMSLEDLIAFIGSADGLIAASTGPLHIAAALGKRAIGLYPPIRPMHPGRWAPIGEKAGFIVENKRCSRCRREGRCLCMERINPTRVAGVLMKDTA